MYTGCHCPVTAGQKGGGGWEMDIRDPPWAQANFPPPRFHGAGGNGTVTVQSKNATENVLSQHVQWVGNNRTTSGVGNTQQLQLQHVVHLVVDKGGPLSAVCAQCDCLGMWLYQKPMLCDTLGIIVV